MSAAALQAGKALLARFARQADVKNGATSVSASQRYKALKDVVASLESDAMSAAVPYLGGTSSKWLRRHWRGTLIGNGGYTPDAAAAHIAAGAFDLIAFGRAFIANPDLVERIADRKPLQAYSRELLDSLE